MKTIAFLAIFLCSHAAFAQGHSYKETYPLTKYKNRWALSAGLAYQQQMFSDINLMVYRIDTTRYLPVTKGARLGFETNFSSQQPVFGPKISYEAAGITIFRITAINYFDNKNSDFRILPEIGLSLCGAINLTYGYNISLTRFKSTAISNNKISLTFLLDFKYWKATGLLK